MSVIPSMSVPKKLDTDFPIVDTTAGTSIPIFLSAVSIPDNPHLIPSHKPVSIPGILPTSHLAVSQTADPNIDTVLIVDPIAIFTLSQLSTTNAVAPAAAAITPATTHPGPGISVNPATMPFIAPPIIANNFASPPAVTANIANRPAILPTVGPMLLNNPKNRVPKRVKNPVNFCHGPNFGGFIAPPQAPFFGNGVSASAANGAPHPIERVLGFLSRRVGIRPLTAPNVSIPCNPA